MVTVARIVVSAIAALATLLIVAVRLALTGIDHIVIVGSR